jgi:phenylalanyl-tRNA synthetase alpha chain
MSRNVLTPEALARALALRDLSDPSQGRHAMQDLLAGVIAALADRWRCPVVVERGSPVVPVADNYDRLHYPPDGAARDARYTRYIDSGSLLRTQTSALVPPLLRRLAAAPPPDALLVCPGLVYRRDVIDRIHTGEPHQVDLWRIRLGPPLRDRDLAEMIDTVATAAAPGRAVRASPARHPYTLDGRQIDVAAEPASAGPAGGGWASPPAGPDSERGSAAGSGSRASGGTGGARDESKRGERPPGKNDWVEIGECGLALPALLRESGLPDDASGLAMGLGLDRLVMLRKGLDDIRLLRAADPRIAGQMLDLEPYRPVSSQPPVRRDLSVAVAAEATAEELGDRVRVALAERAGDVEAVEVLGETPIEALPGPAAARLGIRPGQKNVLLRVVLRSPERTLTDAEANQLRDAVYAALHEGTVHQWATGAPPGWVTSVHRPS